MTSRSKKSTEISESASDVASREMQYAIEIISFGFKNGSAPAANLVFDVRFLKNPYWVEELRPLTGLDEPVRKYVLDQALAQDTLNTLTSLAARIAPAMFETKSHTLTIALGCTGGQHRSTAMVEALADRIEAQCPQYRVKRFHRELDGKPHPEGESDEDGKPAEQGKDLTAPRGSKSR